MVVGEFMKLLEFRSQTAERPAHYPIVPRSSPVGKNLTQPDRVWITDFLSLSVVSRQLSTVSGQLTQMQGPLYGPLS
jgi:hypothetical protein